MNKVTNQLFLIIAHLVWIKLDQAKQISTVSDYHTSWEQPGNERVPLGLHHEMHNTKYPPKSISYLIIFKNNRRRNGFVCYFLKQRFRWSGH